MTKFREPAVTRHKSPEELDDPLKIMPRKTLAATLIVALVAVTGLVWGEFGNVPSSGNGKGVLLTPNTVNPIQAPADGQLVKWRIVVGDYVKKNDEIAVLQQPELVRELAQIKEKFEEVEKKNGRIKILRDNAYELAETLICKKYEILQERIKRKQQYIGEIVAVKRKILAKSEESLKIEKQNLQNSLELMEKIKDQKQRRMNVYQKLLAGDLTSKQKNREVQSEFDDAKLKVSEIKLQLQSLKGKNVELEQAALNLENLTAVEENSLNQLLNQLAGLDNEIADLSKKYAEDEFRDQYELDELKRTASRMQDKLDATGKIVSPFNGRILELTAAEGDVVTAGQRLAQIDTRREKDKLVVFAYFSDSVGNRLTKRAKVRILPTTVDRVQFGSIWGNITEVSAYPVSDEAVANYIGSAEIAKQLTANGRQIEVQIAMQENPSNPSGYQWTSQPGPAVQLEAGTIADVAVTYERRSPLSFVLPFVRKWCGF